MSNPQMSTSSSEPQIDESTLESTTDIKSEDPNPASNEEAEARDGEEEEEEEGECGFCLFMKGGGCKDSFVAWEKCVEEAEERKEDVVSKCVEATVMLKKCMEAHSEYYEPVLRAERLAEEEAVEQLEEEAVKKLEEEAEPGAESWSGSSDGQTG